MRRRTPLLALAVAALAFDAVVEAPCAHAAHQDGARAGDPAEVVARYRAYLARKPFNASAFEGLVEAAAAHEGLAALIEELATELERAPDALAPRVLHARLLTRTGELGRAIEALAAIETRGPELDALQGELLARDERHVEALIALEAAAAAALDRELLRRVHRSRAESNVALGRDEDACAAMLALATLDPNSALTRIEVARWLADRALLEVAVEQYALAAELARDDAAQRCQALFERGRLQERLGRDGAALACFEEALSIVGRDHWLARELRARLVAVHFRRGDLATWIRALAARVDAEPHALGARELLAEALVTDGRSDEALARLEPALLEHPRDRALSERVRALCLSRADEKSWTAECQRWLELHPAEVELRLELGRRLVRAGRSESGERQLERVLERRAGETELVRELAELWLEHGERARAVRLYERALAARPGEIELVADLARVHARAQDTEALAALFARAEEAAAGSAGKLEELARVLRRQRRFEDSERLLAQALALEPDAPRLLTEHAEVLAQLGERQRAAEILRRVLALADAPGGRARAAQRYVEQLRRTRELREALVREMRAIEADRGDLAAHWIATTLHVRLGELGRALAAYEALVAADPGDVGARVELAGLLARLRLEDRAVEQYELLIERAPRRAREFRAKMLGLLASAGDVEGARACLLELQRGAPGNAAVLRETAGWFVRLELHDEARGAYERAVRLQPDHAASRLALAELHAARGDEQAASRELVAAHRHGDEEQSAEVLERLAELHSPAELDELRAELGGRLAAGGSDGATVALFADLLLSGDRAEEALAAVERALEGRPHEPDLLALRGRVLARLGRHDESVAAFEALRRDEEADPERTVYGFLAASLDAGEMERANLLAREARDPVRAARLFVDRERVDEALELLLHTPHRSAYRLSSLRYAAQLYEEIGELALAVRALEEADALAGPSVTSLRGIGALYAELGRTEEVVATGRRLFELAGESPAVAEYFERAGLGPEYAWLRAERALVRPRDEEAVLARIEELLDEPAELPVAAVLIGELRRRALEEAVFPEGHTARSWARLLSGYEREFYAVRSELAHERLIELRDVLAERGRLAEYEWEHLLRSQRLGRAIRERERADFEQALAHHPDSPVLLATIADRHRIAQEDARAAELFARLTAVLERPDERAEAELRERRSEEELLALLRLELGTGDESFLHRAVKLVRTVDEDGAPGPQGPRAVVSRAQALRNLARSRVRLGQLDEARAALARLAPDDPERLPAWRYQAEACIEAGFLEEAEEICERTWRLRHALSGDPALAHWDGWREALHVSWEALGERFGARGEPVRAWRWIRRAQRAGRALDLVLLQDVFEVALSETARRLEALDRELEAAAAATSAADAAEARARFHDECVMQAELLEVLGRHAEARDVYAWLAARLPDDAVALRALGRLAVRDGALDDALARFRAAREVERARLAAARAGAADRRALLLEPAPFLDEVRAALESQREPPQRASWHRAIVATEADPERLFAADSLAIAALHLEAGRADAVAADLELLRTEGVPPELWVPGLALIVDRLDPSPQKIALLQLARESHPTDVDVLRAYVVALLDEYRVEEARRALDDFLAAQPAIDPIEHKILGILDFRVRQAESGER